MSQENGEQRPDFFKDYARFVFTWGCNGVLLRTIVRGFYRAGTPVEISWGADALWLAVRGASNPNPMDFVKYFI